MLLDSWIFITMIDYWIVGYILLCYWIVGYILLMFDYWIV